MTAQELRGYAKGRTRREEILDAALVAFGEVGYRGATLREIAHRCGISHPGLLHHFPRKEVLLEAVLRRRDAVARADFHLDEREGVDLLRGLVEITERNAGSPGVVELFCVVSAEATSPDHPAHTYFVERYRDVRALLVPAMEDLARQGVLRPGVDPAAAATALLAVMDGLQVQWLLDRASNDMAAVLRAHIRALLQTPFP